MSKMCGMCLNWKVVAALAAGGAGILVFAPSLLPAALPFLAVLVCPLSMGLMMWGMGRIGGMEPSACSTDEQMPATRAELSREEQLAQLRAELQTLDTRRKLLARQVTSLEEGEAIKLGEATLRDRQGGLEA
jgi:hypothetical protein